MRTGKKGGEAIVVMLGKGKLQFKFLNKKKEELIYVYQEM